MEKMEKNQKNCIFTYTILLVFSSLLNRVLRYELLLDAKCGLRRVCRPIASYAS